jgi:hypothetical protein
MRAQTIRDPAHMTSIYAPGLTVCNQGDEGSTTEQKSPRRAVGS